MVAGEEEEEADGLEVEGPENRSSWSPLGFELLFDLGGDEQLLFCFLLSIWNKERRMF